MRERWWFRWNGTTTLRVSGQKASREPMQHLMEQVRQKTHHMSLTVIRKMHQKVDRLNRVCDAVSLLRVRAVNGCKRDGGADGTG